LSSLRHVEYYRGILFLTTNRVKAFDEAFLSRIHVALHFSPLSLASKVQVWNAFIRKMGDDVESFSPKQIEELATVTLPGYQWKADQERCEDGSQSCDESRTEG
jgi:SpoVK/Ycf46/Vps4 family AAA+-type ATPase